MVIFGKSDCIRAKCLNFAKSGCIQLKRVAFWQKLLYFAKVVVIGQCVCNRERLLFSGKVFVFVSRVVVFGQSGCIWQKWLYSGKVVVIEQK